MFTRFTCRGYRNVTADDVELGPLTVLLGPNNCGKTNFVRALTFVSDLCDVLDGVAWARPVDRVIQEHGAHRLLRRGQPAESPHATLQWTCRRGVPGDVAAINSAGYEIGIGPRFRAVPQPARNDATAPLLQTEKLHLSVVSGPTSWTREGATLEMAVYDADGVQAYSEEYRDRESFLVQPVGRAVGGDHGKLLSSPADRLARFYGPVGRFECARFDPHEVAQPVRRERNVRLDAQARQLANILADRDNEADGLEAVVARMQELVPDLERLWVPDDADTGAFRSVRAKQRGAVFDLVELSDGTVHALVLATLLTGPRQYGVLCLDQPELNLHPAWLRVLGNWLQRQEGADQVIVTTHAPDLLDTLTAGFRQGDVTVLVFDADGNVRNVDPAELDDRFAEGWELGDLYRVGDPRLGGWPW